MKIRRSNHEGFSLVELMVVGHHQEIAAGFRSNHFVFRIVVDALVHLRRNLGRKFRIATIDPRNAARKISEDFHERSSNVTRAE